MTIEGIIRMAKEAGFADEEIDTCQQILIHFAKLVAEHERDECAKLADISVDFWVKGGFPECAEVRESMHIGEAIRARGQG
jgi:hypothetical protein